MKRRLVVFVAGSVLVLAAFVSAQDPNSGSGGTHPASATPEVSNEQPSDVQPLNITAGGARVLVPDGTSEFDNYTDGAAQWFIAWLEDGKGYAIEAIDTDHDLTLNAVLSIGIFEADGVTPLANAQTACGVAVDRIAPSLEVSGDGKRCVIRPFIGAGLGWPKSVAFVVNQGAGSSFRVRLRESTIYSRWSTNAYDMHVELQNTTGTVANAQVIFYPDTGGATIAAFNDLTVPAYGAAKVVRAAGTLGPALKGTLRVIPAPAGTVFVPGQVNLNTYGFNTLINQYLFFNVERVNNGGANTW